MKAYRSAKQLTFLYFSVVAAAIIVIHATVVAFTIEDIEHLYGETRLNKLSSYASQILEDRDIKGLHKTEIRTQGVTSFDKSPVVYFDDEELPEGFPPIDSLAYDQAVEIKNPGPAPDYFLMKKQLRIKSVDTDVLIVMDNTLYESSEERIYSTHTKQILVSFSLLVVSLLVVVKIADRLTRPMSQFANTLADKGADDLGDIPLPPGAGTRELVGLVETFNHYQQRINDLIERERSFNRYVSHELRSPLTVMQGAISLLAESDDAEFSLKQRLRASKAVHDMREFVETLLALSKSEDNQTIIKRLITDNELVNVVSNHSHLLGAKPVSWSVEIEGAPEIELPEAAFHILIGNLVKNAFSYTEQGAVVIKVDAEGICVVDTGMGLHRQPKQQQGFGLGLLLVRDICHRYGWHFSIDSNAEGGCTAQVLFARVESKPALD